MKSPSLLWSEYATTYDLRAPIPSLLYILSATRANNGHIPENFQPLGSEAIV